MFNLICSWFLIVIRDAIFQSIPFLIWWWLVDNKLWFVHINKYIFTNLHWYDETGNMASTFRIGDIFYFVLSTICRNLVHLSYSFPFLTNLFDCKNRINQIFYLASICKCSFIYHLLTGMYANNWFCVLYIHCCVNAALIISLSAIVIIKFFAHS